MILKLRNCFILVAIVSGIVGCRNKLISINEISADNLGKRFDLYENYGSIRDFGIQQFRPWIRYINQPESIQSSLYVQVDKAKGYADRHSTTITDLNTRTYFKFIYKGGNLITIDIGNSAFSKEAIPFADEFIDYLLKEQEYVYKQTDFKSGSDRLLKLVDNYIISCTVLRDKETIKCFLFQVWCRK